MTRQPREQSPPLPALERSLSAVIGKWLFDDRLRGVQRAVVGLMKQSFTTRFRFTDICNSACTPQNKVAFLDAVDGCRESAAELTRSGHLVFISDASFVSFVHIAQMMLHVSVTDVKMTMKDPMIDNPGQGVLQHRGEGAYARDSRRLEPGPAGNSRCASWTRISECVASVLSVGSHSGDREDRSRDQRGRCTPALSVRLYMP